MKGIMRKLLILCVLVFTYVAGRRHDHNDDHNGHDHDGDGQDCDYEGGEVKDYDRACPEGFFYGGEVDYREVARGEHWIDGGATPVYSCYQTFYGAYDWVQASQKCSDIDGSLVSVNNYHEEDILVGQLFMSRAFSSDISGDEGVGPVLTSGISLQEGNWTWFGAGEEMDDNKTDTMNELMADFNMTNTGAMCVFLNWVNDESTDLATELVYEVRPCIGEYSVALCEVRAYTQTWYVWFSINWLQILFLFTIILLIISSCVTMQVWTSRPARRRPQVSPGSPPPYTPSPTLPPNTTVSQGLGNKYTEKGKEILAKVIYYRKPEDKQKLASDA